MSFFLESFRGKIEKSELKLKIFNYRFDVISDTCSKLIKARDFAVLLESVSNNISRFWFYGTFQLFVFFFQNSKPP